VVWNLFNRKRQARRTAAWRGRHGQAATRPFQAPACVNARRSAVGPTQPSTRPHVCSSLHVLCRCAVPQALLCTARSSMEVDIAPQFGAELKVPPIPLTARNVD
jgi:hypothetical protein